METPAMGVLVKLTRRTCNGLWNTCMINIFLAVSMKYGSVKCIMETFREENVTVNLEADYTNSDTQFQIDKCASLKEARRVHDLPILDLLCSRSCPDWENSTVTFTFLFVYHHPAEQSIIVDKGKIDWNSIEPAPAGVAQQFYDIAMSPKVLEIG